MWVHKMCSVNKSIHICCIVSLSQNATVNETLEKNQSRSDIFAGYLTQGLLHVHCICLLSRIDHVHPLEIKLYVQILSGIVSKFKYFRFLEFMMALSDE